MPTTTIGRCTVGTASTGTAPTSATTTSASTRTLLLLLLLLLLLATASTRRFVGRVGRWTWSKDLLQRATEVVGSHLLPRTRTTVAGSSCTSRALLCVRVLRVQAPPLWLARGKGFLKPRLCIVAATPPAVTVM